MFDLSETIIDLLTNYSSYDNLELYLETIKDEVYANSDINEIRVKGIHKLFKTDNLNPLMYACLNDVPASIIKFLSSHPSIDLNAGSSFGGITSGGVTALALACYQHNVDAVKILIMTNRFTKWTGEVSQLKINNKTKCCVSYPIQHYAVKRYYNNIDTDLSMGEKMFKILKMLFDHPACRINAIDNRNQTILDLFVYAIRNIIWKIDVKKSVIAQIERDCHMIFDLFKFYGVESNNFKLLWSNFEFEHPYYGTGKMYHPEYTSGKFPAPHLLELEWIWRDGTMTPSQRKDFIFRNCSPTELAEDLFCLIVLYCDGFLLFKEMPDDHPVKRFIVMCSRLPMELQKIMCYRTFGSGKSEIVSGAFEMAFRRSVKWLI
jgi:hypothetical protein